MTYEIAIEADSHSTSAVVIDSGGAAHWSWSEWVPEGSRVVVVADPAVHSFTEAVLEGLNKAGIVYSVLWMAIPETEKSLLTVEKLYRQLGERHVTRDSVIVAVGGGVLTDVVGYAAATYLRGLQWIAVPTTLLAQVDAAIGGKVAVNTEFGKNLVGAFHLPRIVAIDPGALATLPLREWQAGVGEVVKSALIAGPPLLDFLTRGCPPLGHMNTWWEEVISETAALKARIVSEDLYEHNARMFLNFGHTAGHALENFLGYGTLTHGEAVVLGCLVALNLSETILGLDPAVAEVMRDWMGRWDLPTVAPLFDPDALVNIMAQDKKARAYGLQWVLLENIGMPRVVRNVPPDAISAALKTIQSAGA
jgi:3-dehydroquinate synthase